FDVFIQFMLAFYTYHAATTESYTLSHTTLFRSHAVRPRVAPPPGDLGRPGDPGVRLRCRAHRLPHRGPRRPPRAAARVPRPAAGRAGPRPLPDRRARHRRRGHPRRPRHPHASLAPPALPAAAPGHALRTGRLPARPPRPAARR